MANKNILLLGLPASGKTTFTAALWYYVTQYTDNLSIRLHTLAEGDHEYLNEIRDNWAQYDLVPRTPLNNPKGERIVMNLNHYSTGNSIILTIPDFSGEIFKDQFESREWSKKHESILSGISGLILFVNATDKDNIPRYIGHKNELESILGHNTEQNNSPSPLTEWNANFVPTQVKLVDALELLKLHKPDILPLKVSMVISSWDKVENPDYSSVTPKEWLELNFPFLSQFLECNKDDLNTAIFGISAQGVDYSDEGKMKEILNKHHTERILVKEGNQISKDISIPISWLF